MGDIYAFQADGITKFYKNQKSIFDLLTLCLPYINLMFTLDQ